MRYLKVSHGGPAQLCSVEGADASMCSSNETLQSTTLQGQASSSPALEGESPGLLSRLGTSSKGHALLRIPSSA